jgi:hypothetical protein
MDLAAAAGGPAGAAGGRGPERHSATGQMTTRPQGVGRRVSPEHGTWSYRKPVDVACAGDCFDVIGIEPGNTKEIGFLVATSTCSAVDAEIGLVSS